MKSYKYKIKHPAKAIVEKFEQTLDICRELYNAALCERRDAWNLNRVSISFLDQASQLPAIKAVRDDLKTVYAQVLQDVLRRLDKSFNAFFEGIKKGKKAGFPKFKAHQRFYSFCFPQGGFKLIGDRLMLSKIGTLRLYLSRKVTGTIKTCTIKREVDGWYVIFAAETPKEILEKTGKSIGVDVGLNHFITLSNGKQFENPRFFRGSEKIIKKAQRAVSRKKKDSRSRKKAVFNLRRKYLKIKRRRTDFLQKIANYLIKNFDEIAVENLSIRNMLNNRRLAKAIGDASWGDFLIMLTGKAEHAGRKIWKVSPVNTSQTCLCGKRVKKTLAVRRHKCPQCGLIADRDVVAAQIILRRAGLNP